MHRRNKLPDTGWKIPEHVFKEAESRAEKQQIFDRSHRGEKANQIGCLGEVIAEHWFEKWGIQYKSELDQTTHDYRINNLTVDVKTKDRTVKPLDHYDNSAPLYNHSHQKPDYFLFVSLVRGKPKNKNLNDIRVYHTAYIVGSISYDELNKIGIPFFKDEKDWRNGTTFWTDCLNVEMWQLISLPETVEIFTGRQDSAKLSSGINHKVIKQMKKLIIEGKYKQRSFPDNSKIRI